MRFFVGGAGDRRAGRPRRSRPATPTAVEYKPSFVDGSGSRELIPRVWEHASRAPRRRVRAAARRGRRRRAADRRAHARDRRRVPVRWPSPRRCPAASPARGRSSASCRAETSTPPCSSGSCRGRRRERRRGSQPVLVAAERVRVLRRAGRHAGARRGRAGDRERAARGVGKSRRARTRQAVPSRRSSSGRRTTLRGSSGAPPTRSRSA